MKSWTASLKLQNMKKHNEQSLKDILSQFKQDHKFSQHLSELKLRETWAQEMGNTIAKYTAKIYFRNGILYVKLDSSVLRHELHTNRETVITKLNKALGESLVKELSLQ